MRAKFITIKYYDDDSGEPVVGIHSIEDNMLDAVCDTIAGNRTVVIMLTTDNQNFPNARIIYSDLRAGD
jgi:hypothetical protein